MFVLSLHRASFSDLLIPPLSRVQIVHVWIQTGELIVFDRERDDRLYSVVPYVAASWLSFLPGNVIFPTVYAIIIYFMGGLRPDNLAVNVLSFIAQVSHYFPFYYAVESLLTLFVRLYCSNLLHRAMP